MHRVLDAQRSTPAGLPKYGSSFWAPGTDHEVAQAQWLDRPRGLSDRLLLGDSQPADRGRTVVLAGVLRGTGCTLASVGLLGEQGLQVQRRALHVELEGLAVGEPRGDLRKRSGDSLALGLLDGKRVDRSHLEIADVGAVLPDHQPVRLDRGDTK